MVQVGLHVIAKSLELNRVGRSNGRYGSTQNQPENIRVNSHLKVL